MWSVLRAVFMCLMMLAVPVQGYAASAMRLCGAGHADGPAHQHAPTTVHAEVAEPEAADATHAHAAQAKCSVCASCCSAAALTSEPTLPRATRAGGLVIATPVPSRTTFLTDGPDRPPRPFLA